PAGTNVSLAEPWTRTKRRLRRASRFVSSGSPEYLGAEADGHPPRPAGVSEVGRKLHRLVRACKSIPDSRSSGFQEFSAHILTRRASEGSEALPSLARRVRMSFFGARVIHPRIAVRRGRHAGLLLI